MKLKAIFLVKAFIALVVILQISACSSKNENSINLRLESFAINLSPLKISDTESMQVASLLYSPLVAVNADGIIEPRIAKKWRQVDEKTWEFELKSDITFSDGKPLKANDVISSLTKAMQPTSPWAWALTNIMHENDKDNKIVKCSGLQELNEYTIRIILTKPDPLLLHKLDSPPGWIIPNNSTEGEYGILPGTGPYTVAKVTPDVSILLSARTKGSVSIPKAKNIAFNFIADESQAAKMFASGSLDAINIGTPKLLEQLTIKKDKSIVLKNEGALINIPSERIRLIIVNEQKLKEKKFSDENISTFMKSINFYVNRNEIVVLGNGILSEPLKTAFPPANNSSTIINPPSETEVAKLPHIKLTVLTESDPYSDLIASVISKTKINNVEFSYKGMEKGLLIKSLVTKDYEIVSILLDANLKVPAYWTSFFLEESPFVVFGKPIPELANIDLNTNEGITKAGELISMNGNWIGLVKERRIFAMQKGVSDIRFTLSGQPRYENIKKSE